MTLTADPTESPLARSRRLSRQARQMRVGILRNPNDPPRPPARKTALMGRWLSLRSSRRPPLAQLREEVPDPPTVSAALRHDAGGQLAGIDIAGLMASVDELGTTRPIRTPFASATPSAPPPDAPLRRRKPSVLTAEAWVEPEDAPEPPPPVLRPQRKPGILRPVLGGVGLALVILVVIPAFLIR